MHTQKDREPAHERGRTAPKGSTRRGPKQPATSPVSTQQHITYHTVVATRCLTAPCTALQLLGHPQRCGMTEQNLVALETPHVLQSLQIQH